MGGSLVSYSLTAVANVGKRWNRPRLRLSCGRSQEVYIKSGALELYLLDIFSASAMNCSLSTISNRTSGFEFVGLYAVYTYLNETCAAGSEVFLEGTRMLTNGACQRMTGLGSNIWTGWTAYPISDIWNRIVVWKLPLLQLISQFPRPPLGPSVETGIMMHLLGDPIDSFTSMFVSLAICQQRAQQAMDLCGSRQNDPDFPKAWKGLAIIMVSYDECGLSEKVDSFAQA